MSQASEKLPAAYEDYLAVDSKGRAVAGPFKYYDQAKLHADRAGGFVKFAAEAAQEDAFDPSALGEVPSAAAAVPVVEPTGCRPWLQVQKDPAAFNACMQLAAKVGPIEGHHQLYEVVRHHVQRQDQEIFVVAMLDTQLQLRGLTEVARGARDRVPTPVPDIARAAMTVAVHYGAMGVAVCHGHPSGKPRPSQADREVTEAIESMCESLGLLFLDHLVIGSEGNGYFSFKAGRIIKPSR